MKLKFKIAALVVGIAICAALFAAFRAPEMKVDVQETQFGKHITAGGDFRASGAVPVVFPHDTLTTTENDTLTLGQTFESPYQYAWQLKVVKISGTPSLKAVLDSRNSLSNSDWVGIDSISISGADSVKTWFLLKGANTWGLKQRLRLMGTTGINQYDITALLKPTN